MPKERHIHDIKKHFEEINVKFTQWKKSLPRAVSAELGEDIETLENDLKRFADQVEACEESKKYVELDNDAQTAQAFERLLGIIINDHERLAQSAKSVSPTIAQHIKAYLSVIIEPFEKLFRSVSNFVHQTSKKAKSTIATGFDSFKASMRNIPKREDKASARNSKQNPNSMI